ncbi:hypothetical protein DAI43_28525 [Achromobacter xylosoxidans]|nr:hypothetical protein DAI43_28525 [Achromobacter xylosoxidans]
MFLAAPGIPDMRRVLFGTLGIWLLAAAAFAINCLIEQEIDARMLRTARRGTARGTISAFQVLSMSGLLGGAGMFVLYHLVNPLTMWLTFATFVGYAVIYTVMQRAREQLEIFIAAARKRGEALDHVLLFGPPGLGKTTLAHIIAHEMGVQLRQTSGPVLERPGDLAALLTNLEKNDVLFIDEIHRLSPVVEEILYPALEDFQIDILIGEGPAARSVKLDLQPFTLVGATTRAGMLTTHAQALSSGVRS